MESFQPNKNCKAQFKAPEMQILSSCPFNSFNLSEDPECYQLYSLQDRKCIEPEKATEERPLASMGPPA